MLEITMTRKSCKYLHATYGVLNSCFDLIRYVYIWFCICLYGFVWFDFFVKWYINLCRLFSAKAILLKEQLWYYLTHIWEDKGINIPKGICPKVNVIARLEYELAYYDSAVHCLTILPRGHPLYI